MNNLITQCAWCRRVRLLDGTWAPVNEEDLKDFRVRHGMCKDCYNASDKSVGLDTAGVNG